MFARLAGLRMLRLCSSPMSCAALATLGCCQRGLLSDWCRRLQLDVTTASGTLGS